MFTGLIQTTGFAQLIDDYQLQISWDTTGLEGGQDLEIGDSVAVDGVCLTVTHMLDTGFIAAVSPETLDRSTLVACLTDTLVNLELSLRVGSKLGGHFVTGHVDGVGYMTESIVTATSWEMSFNVTDERVARYIVPKGSIAVNGISLTVAECDLSGSWFKVAVIPLTFAETNLRHLQPGAVVNLEGDVLGKYVEKFLRLGSSARSTSASDVAEASPLRETLSPLFLADHGYL